MVARHAIVIILLSFFILLLPDFSKGILHLLLSAHNWISDALMNIFTAGTIGNWVRRLISALFIPVLAGALPAAIFWAVKRKEMPYTLHVVWIVWIIQIVVITLDASLFVTPITASAGAAVGGVS